VVGSVYGRGFSSENPATVDFDLQPYESRLILLTDSATQIKKAQPTVRSRAKIIDLTTDWRVAFDGRNQTIAMAKLHSWSEDPTFKHYSGQVSYLKTFDLSSQDLSPGTNGVLDFGTGNTD